MIDAFQKEITDLAKKNVTTIVGIVVSSIKGAYAELQLEMGTAFLEYLDLSIKKYSEIKTILFKDSPVPLYSFYVNLELGLGKKTIATDSVLNLLEVSKRLIISGTAGMGKSTLLKHLFLDTLKCGEYIPIFIELRYLNVNSMSLSDYIYSRFNTLNFRLEQKYLFKTFDRGKILLFLDGYDELDPDKRSVIAHEILNLSDKYLNSCFIISSRPDDCLVGWQNFTELRVLPMAKLKALELVMKLQYDEEIKTKFFAALDRELYEKQISFASNPLLLTIMLLTFSQYAGIPTKMSVFYGQAFDALYYRHDATKGAYKRSLHTELQMDDFQRVLACFSLQSCLNSQITFLHNEALQLLISARDITNVSFKEEPYLQDLLKSVCVLIQDGIHYTYTHRTFQEYFAAVFVTLQPDELQVNLLPRFARLNSNVLLLLNEMDSLGLERNLIIPCLKKIARLTDYGKIPNEDALIKFVNLGYDRISKGSNGGIALCVKESNNIYLCEIVLHYYNMSCKTRRYDNLAKYKKFFDKIDKNKLGDYISIQELVESKSMGKETVEILTQVFPSYFYSMEMLPQLKERQAKQKQSIHELLLKSPRGKQRLKG